MKRVRLSNISNITKLAGFEHTEYIQPNATKTKINENDVPMYLGLNIKEGKLVEDIHWYISYTLSKKLERSALTKRCLVLPYVGSVGDLAIFNARERHHLASNVAKIELLNEKLFSTEYLYYYLKSPYGQRQLLFFVQGGVQKNITMDAIRKTEVLVVPNAESVVKLLATFDNKIELNNKINAELEAMAKLIYDYWFVQFDFPDENGKPYKSSGGKMRWSEELKREIPEGWEVENMLKNSLSEIIKPKIKKFDGKKTYIATADVNDLNMDRGSQVTYENRESRANMQPIANSVWFAKMKESVKHIFVNEISSDLINTHIFSTGFMGLKVKPEAFEYISSVIHHPYFEIVKDFNTNGATMSAVGNNNLKNIPLTVPSPDIITTYHKLYSPIFNKLDRNRQESRTLSTLRDWLLPMLMNGQLMVK